MVKKRHGPPAAIIDVPWRSRQPRAEVEVLRVSDVAPRVPNGRVERAQFHLFVLYLRGRCAHDVDFEVHPCAPGTLLRVQPGQVQRWRLRSDIEGTVLVFKPAFLFPDRPRTGALWTERFFEDVAWPAALHLAGGHLAAAEDWFARLERTAREVDDSPIATALLRHLVSATLLDLARRCALGRAPSPLGAAERTRARQLEADVERSFRVTRSVADYAQRLGCSPVTLDRTCRAAFGVSAKAHIDARVVLEARRLLSHTALSVAAIAEDLGFSEATNFVKFFKARTSELPGAFRAAQALTDHE